MSKLIDAHAHLDLSSNVLETINYIEKKEIYVLAVTNHPKVYEYMRNNYITKNIRYCLGYHPELISETYDFNAFKNLFNSTSYIGEIGFDKNNNEKYQIEFLDKLINLVSIGSKKILNVHSRGLSNDFINIINRFINGKVIFHWFSGTEASIKKIKLDNAYFSFNKAMMNSLKGKSLCKIIPENKILTESDFPFINNKKRIYEIDDITETLNKLAKEYGRSFDEMKNIVFNNFCNMVNSLK